MKIGILGSGDVGKALGRGFVAEGHEVTIGSREPAKLNAWKTEVGTRGRAGTFEEAARFGEIVVIATLWSGTKDAIDLANADNLRNKIVIDVTNPLVFSESGPGLALGHTDSGGEQVQRWLPDSRVVKAFNSVGNALMYKPQLPNGPPTMFIAGNDESAKQRVTEILTSFGWETDDTGGIESARLLEPLCILWVRYGMATNTWDHAFKLLHK
ncbi:MAG: NAD(P)-binding domain-containing protein [Candidatus Eremiobacteraeota bacterium]|nr:NAD(P)-binding domain-containing protein [Candidatus Eremiobacteraeota bacterium]